MKVNEGVAGHRTSVLSGQNFPQICLASHRDLSCGSHNAEMDRPLRRTMLKKYASPPELASGMRLLDPPCVSRPFARSPNQHPPPRRLRSDISFILAKS